VREALHEDEAFNDVTTLATVLSAVTRAGGWWRGQGGVLAGVALAVEAFRQVDRRINVRRRRPGTAARSCRTRRCSSSRDTRAASCPPSAWRSTSCSASRAWRR
jgi:hypothetical protein